MPTAPRRSSARPARPPARGAAEVEHCGMSRRRGSADQPEADYAAGPEQVFAGLARGELRCPPDVFQKTRAWFIGHWWLREWLALHLAYLNCRLRVTVSGKGQKTWLSPDREASIRSFVGRALREAAVSSNLLVFWRERGPLPVHSPVLLRPESVVYDDALGIEAVRVFAALTPAQLALLPSAERRRYEGGSFVVSAEHGEQVRVWKDGAPGDGLAWPALFAAFRTLGQSDSMEVGEGEYAFAGRLVQRVHEKGHETRYGPNAGGAKNFANKPWAAEVMRFYEGALGFRETWRNFDQKMLLEWLDVKLFDGAKWETIERRLTAWGGPLARLVAGPAPNPDLAGALQTELEARRAELGGFLEPVLAKAFKAPGQISLRWSNQCFKGQRILGELMKWGVQQGFVSDRTAADDLLGRDALDHELENKRAELEDAALLQPLVLPHAGKGGPGGKPELSAPGGRPGAGQET